MLQFGNQAETKKYVTSVIYPEESNNDRGFYTSTKQQHLNIKKIEHLQNLLTNFTDFINKEKVVNEIENLKESTQMYLKQRIKQLTDISNETLCDKEKVNSEIARLQSKITKLDNDEKEKEKQIEMEKSNKLKEIIENADKSKIAEILDYKSALEKKARIEKEKQRCINEYKSQNELKSISFDNNKIPIDMVRGIVPFITTYNGYIITKVVVATDKVMLTLNTSAFDNQNTTSICFNNYGEFIQFLTSPNFYNAITGTVAKFDFFDCSLPNNESNQRTNEMFKIEHINGNFKYNTSKSTICFSLI